MCFEVACLLRTYVIAAAQQTQNLKVSSYSKAVVRKGGNVRDFCVAENLVFNGPLFLVVPTFWMAGVTNYDDVGWQGTSEKYYRPRRDESPVIN